MHTLGSVSLKKNMTNTKSARANITANDAGTTNQFPVLLRAQIAKMAPIIGPMMNPNEKAIPTKA